MKLWALLITLLYVILIAALAGPLLWICLNKDDAPNISYFYSSWATWITIGGFGIAQAVLLLVPVGVAGGRPVSRRKLLVPVITTAFLFALLFAGVALSAIIGLLGDKDYGLAGMPLLIASITSWVLWAWLFWSFADNGNPERVMTRLMNWLLAGSILELVVAVPAHVAVRRRDDCCAPAGTFLGIATGIAIGLMSFGPGLFFFYAKRTRRLKGQS